MESPSWGQYELLRPAQIDAIRSQSPIAYLPWGALEWHSYHNPVGLDGMLAHGQCKALAKETGGVVLPPVYVGTDTIKPYKGFNHTLEHAPDTVTLLCREFLEQLTDEMFKVIILITGHCGGRHTEALEKAVSHVSAQHPDVGFRFIPAFEPTKDVYPSNHAARGETDLQLLFKPDVVDISLLPDDRAPTLDEDGIWGENPREATAEEGAAILQLFVERTLPAIHELIDRHTS